QPRQESKSHLETAHGTKTNGFNRWQLPSPQLPWQLGNFVPTNFSTHSSQQDYGARPICQSPSIWQRLWQLLPPRVWQPFSPRNQERDGFGGQSSSTLSIPATEPSAWTMNPADARQSVFACRTRARCWNVASPAVRDV